MGSFNSEDVVAEIKDAETLVLELVRDLIVEISPDEVATFDLVGSAELENIRKGSDALDDPMMGETSDLVFQIALMLCGPLFRDAAFRGASRGINYAKPKIRDLLLSILKKKEEELRSEGQSRQLDTVRRLIALLEAW